MDAKDLPDAARQALEDAGIDLLAAICVDKQGNIHRVKGQDVNERSAKFPIQTTEIQGITSVGMVRHKGSDCWTIIIDGIPYTFCYP